MSGSGNEARRMHEYAEHWNSFDHQTQLRYFNELPQALRAELFIQLDTVQQELIINRITSEALRRVVQECDPDDLVDIMQSVHDDARERLWGVLPAKQRAETKALLKYAQTDAAGVMTSRYVAVQADLTVKETIAYLRDAGQQAETIYYIYVIDEQKRLRGVVSLRDVLISANDCHISKIMATDVVSVSSDTDQEDAAKLLSSYGFLALPVRDDDGRMLGIITFDDVIDVFRAEQTEDVYKMSAVNASTGQYLNTTAATLVAKRVPWLIFLLLFGTITTNIISGFHSVLLMSAFVVWFIPVITQTGGNSGTQSATLMIRGLAMGEIHWRDVWRVIGKELVVGAVMGAILGAALLLRGVFLPPQIAFFSALSISGALSIVVLISSLIGALFPLIIYKCGFDPTVMAGPLMATVIDAVGITIYLLIVRSLL